jgi:hypothetical protein
MHEKTIKAQLLEINRQVRSLIDTMGETAPASEEMAAEWVRTSQSCEIRLDDDLLRMAVVGTIKSGKSTFINSLFAGDYLKRGAGVITSIVTKVRASDTLRAALYFKSWEEINAEINQSLRIFFSAGLQTRNDGFDIRDGEDRQWLDNALASLESRHLLHKDTRNMDHVLLAAYLKGYQDVKEIVSDDNKVVYYDNEMFPRHRDYSGSEYLSAFLKDLKLEINSGDLEWNIEIADCQGSDSPNPLHLAMIQDYLHTADLVVYIISSRTGLRQADIRFLNMIKNMAGMNHVLFVLNADFNEHDSIEDLHRVAGKVREELELIVANPAVYIFSSLFFLLAAGREDIPEKDRMRLRQWEMDHVLVSFSKNEQNEFLRHFRKMITEQRFSILFRNQLYCLNMLISDVGKWLDISYQVLTSNREGAAGLFDKLGKQQEQTDQVRSMIKTTLDGAVSQLSKEIKSEVDNFFEARDNGLVPGILEFVRGYTVSYEESGYLLEKGDFAGALYAVFQSFKQDLDRHVAEKVNPFLIGFIKKKEEEIVGYFESLAAPYRKLVVNADGDESLTEAVKVSIDLSYIKKTQGLAIPSAAATLDYTNTIRTEAFMKLGFYRFTNAVKKLFKVYKSTEHRDMPALRAGVRQMKKETEASLVFYFKNYRENIKYQHFFKLINGVSEEMRSQLANRFTGYQANLSRLKSMANENREIKAKTISDIDDIKTRLAVVRRELEKIGQTL